MRLSEICPVNGSKVFWPCDLCACTDCRRVDSRQKLISLISFQPNCEIRLKASPAAKIQPLFSYLSLSLTMR